MPDADPTTPHTPRHPIAFFFHWFFKVSAMVFYAISDFIPGLNDNFTLQFVVSVVLIALDFWTVKNVTGRKLVGLRWWNEANDSGSAWRFESAPEGSRTIHAAEKRGFWIGLLVDVGVWGFFLFWAIIRFKLTTLIIPIIALIMGSSNLFGYFKCSREAKDQLSSIAGDLTKKAMMRGATHALTSRV